MRGDLQARFRRLLDNETNVVLRVDVWLVIHRHLDDARAEVDVLPDRLSHLVARIGEEVLRLGEPPLVGLQAELAAERGDDPTGIQERRTDDHAVLDGPTNARTGIVALVADVAHRREAGFEHRAGIHDALDGAERVRILQCGEEVIAGVTPHVDVHA